MELVLQIFYFVGNRSLLFRRHAVPIYRTDEHMGFGVKRNLEFHHVTGEFDIMLYTNEDGFRTSASREKHELPKPSSKFRVLLMGPSFAFGWGVNHEATVAHLLQNRLVDTRLTGGREIEVINAGVPAIPLPNQLN